MYSYFKIITDVSIMLKFETGRPEQHSVGGITDYFAKMSLSSAHLIVLRKEMNLQICQLSQMEMYSLDTTH